MKTISKQQLHLATWGPAATPTSASRMTSELIAKSETDQIVNAWHVFMEFFIYRCCKKCQQLRRRNRGRERSVEEEDRGCSCPIVQNWREDVRFITCCAQTDSVLNSSLEDVLELNFIESCVKPYFQFF